MYKFIFVLLVVVGMTTASNAQEKQNMKQSDNKPLVAYFSVTGTTARAAEKLARVTGGELYVITPVESYTNADLDWNDKRSRSSVEMNDPKSRPAIQEAKKNIADYDVIFIGYPIWWNLAPRIIDTFIETHHLAGKTLIPFAIGWKRHYQQCRRIEKGLSRAELERGKVTEPNGRERYP